MGTTLLTRKESLGLSVARSLLVIWKHPETRRLRRVGKLDQLTDGRFAFSYLDEAREAKDFRPLVAFPDMDSTYVSENPELPIEILARTGGPRATDTFHIVDAPNPNEDGVVTRFFVSGVKHCEGAMDRIQSLTDGAQLALRAEPDNEFNPHAVLIDESNNSPIGWVPDWLLAELQPLIQGDRNLRIFVEKINLEAPTHLSVLCRLEASSEAVER